MLNYLLSLRRRAPELDETPRDDAIRQLQGAPERTGIEPVTKRVTWREMPVQHITAVAQ
ncbi:MAG TPA: hypothetical protein VH591_17040 [Ktedonobacterales bacterium]|jgi:hypothetical protein